MTLLQSDWFERDSILYLAVQEVQTVPAVLLALEVPVVRLAQQGQGHLEVHGRQDIQCFQQVQLHLVDRKVQADLQIQYFLVVLPVQ